MAELIEYLRKARELGASDLYIIAGCPVTVKCHGELQSLDGEKLLPPRTEELIDGLYKLAGRSMRDYINGCRDAFTFSVASLARFRVNAYRQRNSMAAVIRIVSFVIPHWEEMHIPAPVMELADLKRGLILCTGGAGSGKSTTQACMVDQINRTRSCHIVTLEDPIEFLYRDEKSIISQQEIGVDAEDILTALKYCIQQSPDVILLGNINSPELLRAAMSAAEGGRLVIASLPTKGVFLGLSYLLELFPPEQQAYARSQIANVLRGVVSQQLLPDKVGGVVPAFEYLTFNRFIAGMFRDGQEGEIAAAVSVGRGTGLITMDQSITELLQKGDITMDAALGAADNPDQIRRRCG